jgi:hypothetical protein
MDNLQKIRNAGVYTDKEALAQYIAALERQIQSVEDFRELLAVKYQRSLVKSALLRISKSEIPWNWQS